MIIASSLPALLATPRLRRRERVRIYPLFLFAPDFFPFSFYPSPSRSVRLSKGYALARQVEQRRVYLCLTDPVGSYAIRGFRRGSTCKLLGLGFREKRVIATRYLQAPREREVRHRPRMIFRDRNTRNRPWILIRFSLDAASI